MSKRLSKPMRQTLLKIAEVNHGGLNHGTMKALRRRGLIEATVRGLQLTDKGWKWWRDQNYAKPGDTDD